MFQWGVASKRRSAITLLLVAASLVLPAMGAAPASAEPRPSAPVVEKDAKDRYAIGDSVMLGAKTQLKRRGFIVNATVSRQAYSAPAMVRKRSADLPRNLVVHLGTNGTFPLDTCRRLVRQAGEQRRVFLVTVSVPRSWEASNNRTIRRCAASFADGRVTVVDWKALASRHPGWFYSDGVHLRSAGALAYARLLDRAVDSR